MKILAIGAHHGVGALFVRLAREAGHAVTVFEGDVLEAANVDRAVAGHDAVVSTLGPRHGSPPGMCTKGETNIVAAMRAHGVRRLVQITGAMIGHPREKLGLLYRTMVALLPRASLADRQEQERIVTASGLDWTLVRPTRLTDGPATGLWREDSQAKVGAFARIARADVAAALLRAVGDDATTGRALTLQY